jgi:hypothetical protein
MRPQLAMTEQTAAFLDFLAGATDDFAVSRRERFDRWVGIRASMSLAPEWAQRLTGTSMPAAAQRWWLQPTDRLKAAVVRWSVPELPCKRMAIARATRAAEAPRDARVA